MPAEDVYPALLQSDALNLLQHRDAGVQTCPAMKHRDHLARDAAPIDTHTSTDLSDAGSYVNNSDAWLGGVAEVRVVYDGCAAGSRSSMALCMCLKGSVLLQALVGADTRVLGGRAQHLSSSALQ